MYKSLYYALLLFISITSIHAEKAKFLGRVNPKTRQLTWPGTGFTFGFHGTRANIQFSEVVGSNSLLITVDHDPPYIINSIPYSHPIINLIPGEHRVTVEKRNEFSYGSLTFDGVTTDGELLETISSTLPRIEFIGDSVTAGWGAAGVNPCVNSAAMEDAPNTYAGMTARALDVPYAIIAWSGKGLFRNANTLGSDYDPSDPKMPELWTRYGADDEDHSYTFPGADPAAIVINLGTNDYAYQPPAPENGAETGRDTDSGSDSGIGRGPLQQTDYTQAYITFVTAIRRQYPNAEIFLCSSVMLIDGFLGGSGTHHADQVKALEEVRKAMGNTKITIVDFDSQVIGHTLNGCDVHPGPTGHKEMADQLTRHIASVLNWSHQTPQPVYGNLTRES